MNEVEHWLQSINLGQYWPNFEEDGWVDLDMVADMGEEDWKELGVGAEKKSHLIKMRNAAQQLVRTKRMGWRSKFRAAASAVAVSTPHSLSARCVPLPSPGRSARPPEVRVFLLLLRRPACLLATARFECGETSPLSPPSPLRRMREAMVATLTTIYRTCVPLLLSATACQRASGPAVRAAAMTPARRPIAATPMLMLRTRRTLHGERAKPRGVRLQILVPLKDGAMWPS